MNLTSSISRVLTVW